ncbi:MAG: PASTA domain-containing protein [Pseudonocardia sediminis]
MRTSILLPTLFVAAGVLAGCGGGGPASAPATVTQTVPAAAPTSDPAASPSAAPVKDVTLPDVEGKNGRIVFEQLTELGLTNFEMASQDEEDKFVVNPANWTAVEIEPGPGETVKSDSTVVVTMTKKG